MLCQLAQMGVVGVQGLHQHPAGVSGPSGSPGHLLQQLGAMLQRAEVGGIEAAIGIDHHDQGDMGQVVTLGQHLRAHQQAGLAAMDLLEHLLEALLLAGAVAVDTVYDGVRKEPLQGLFGTFGAAPQCAQVAAAALGAGIGQGASAVAVVAGQQRGCLCSVMRASH